MNLPVPVRNWLTRALAWAGRNLLYIILACAAIFAFSTLRACQEGSKTKQEYKANPPLRRREAKALRKKSKADSVKAVVYKQIAIKAVQQKDSALTIARTKTAQADSIHAQIATLPAAADGPVSAIQDFLANYQGADTTAH